MKQLITFAAAILLAPIVFGQDELLPEEPQDEIRRYTVELIIFSYAQHVSSGTEVFVPDIIAVTDPLSAERPEDLVFEDAAAIQEETEVPVVREINLAMLGEDDLALIDVMGRLERLDAYEPLMHFGWTQTTYPEEETPSIELRAFGEPPPGLDGSLTLYLSRYLHLVVDLVMDGEKVEDPSQATMDSDYSFTDERAYADRYDEPLTGPVRYRIEENRIIKNGEVRYFDHPKFGVIAKVSRVEEVEPAEDESEDALKLLGSNSQ